MFVQDGVTGSCISVIFKERIPSNRKNGTEKGPNTYETRMNAWRRGSKTQMAMGNEKILEKDVVGLNCSTTGFVFYLLHSIMLIGLRLEVRLENTGVTFRSAALGRKEIGGTGGWIAPGDVDGEKTSTGH